MSEMSERFMALQDRVKHLQERVKDPNLTPDEKVELLNQCLGIAISTSEIALEKMKRGDTA